MESKATSALNRVSIDAVVDDALPLITNYTFNGQEGDPISLEVAQRWTTNFKIDNPTGTKAHFFGLEILKLLLAEEGCVGIRMYYAIDDEGKRQIILVGVNSNGDDLLPASMQLDGDGGNIVADASYPCPSFCPPGSGL
jgi:hypothetical protein